MPWKFPDWRQDFFLRLQKIFWQNWAFSTFIEKNKHAVIILLLKQICHFKVSYFNSGVKFQKSFWAILKSLKKLGRQLSFQKFLVSEILTPPQYQFMRMIPFGRSLRNSKNFNLNFRFFIVQILPLLIAQIKDGWLPNFTTNLGLCF